MPGWRGASWTIWACRPGRRHDRSGGRPQTSVAQNDTGTGRVFDPNFPVVTLRDEALTDHNDHNFTAILGAYKDAS